MSYFQPIHITCTAYSYWSKASGHTSRIARITFTGTNITLTLDNNSNIIPRLCKHAVEALGLGEAWGGVVTEEVDVGYNAYRALVVQCEPPSEDSAQLIKDHLRESLQAWQEHLGCLGAQS